MSRTGDTATAVLDLPGDQAPRNKWPILGSIMLITLLAALDGTIVGTAMPRIITQLNGFDRYAWITTIYLLPATVTVPIYGKLADLFGSKPIMLFGTVVFLLGSALSGMAQTMTQLIVFRGLQGFGAGALTPVAITILGAIFPPKQRARWQGLAAAIGTLAVVVAPTLGGFITDHFSWRWIFYLNLPLGLVALATLAFAMPALRLNDAPVRIDAVGALLLIAGTIALLIAVSWGGTRYPWSSPRVVLLLLGACALLFVFVVLEARHPEPILEPRLFRYRIFSIAIATVTLVGAAMLIPITYLPLFVQGVTGTSATTSGAILTPLTLTATIGSAVSGQLLSRWGRYRPIALAGLLLMVIGMLLIVQLTARSRSSDVLLGLLLLGTGFGSGAALYSIAVQNALPITRLGQISSALIFFRSIGGIVSVSLAGSFLAISYTRDLGARITTMTGVSMTMVQRHALDNPQVLLQADLRQSLLHTLAQHSRNGRQEYAALINAVRQALATALHDVFMGSLALTFLALVVVVFLPAIPLQDHLHSDGHLSPVDTAATPTVAD